MSQQKPVNDNAFEELDRELIARGAQKIKPGDILWHDPQGTPERNEIMARIKKLYDSASKPSEKYKKYSDNDLVKMLKDEAKGEKKEETDDKHRRGIIADDDRLDFYELEEIVLAYNNPTPADTVQSKNRPIDEENFQKLIRQTDLKKLNNIKKNHDAVAMICFDDCVTIKNEWATLNVKDYKKTFSLCDCERFSNQPIAAKYACTCFLVSDDVVATAGHFLQSGRNPQDFRVVFGYKMENAFTAITQVPKEKVYHGAEFIGIQCNRDKKTPDWGLLRLDRKVEGQYIAKLAQSLISIGQSIYTIGHPAGLPLKFATGAHIQDTESECLFSADLDVFMGNSGSPVFDMETHDVIGMAVKGYDQDYRLLDKCWISLVYPKPGENTPLSGCTRSSVFREPVEQERARFAKNKS